MDMIVQDATLDRAIFLVIGLILGMILGWARSVYLNVKCARAAAERVERMLRMRNEYGLMLLHRKSLLLVIGVTVAGAVLSGLAAVKQANISDDIHSTQGCFGTSLGSVIESLNERTSLSSELNQANKAAVEADQDQTQAFSVLIATVLKTPPASEKQARRVFILYQQTLMRKQEAQDKYLELLTNTETAQKTNPFPSVKDYNACLKRAGKSEEK